MDANTWLWIALIAFLIFCCLPMLRMGRHDKRSARSNKTDRGGTSSEGGDKSS